MGNPSMAAVFWSMKPAPKNVGIPVEEAAAEAAEAAADALIALGLFGYLDQPGWAVT